MWPLKRSKVSDGLKEKVLQSQGLKPGAVRQVKGSEWPEPLVRPLTEQTLRTDGCEEVNRVLRSIASEPVGASFH